MANKIFTIAIATSIIFSACHNNSNSGVKSDKDTQKITTIQDTQKVKKETAVVVKFTDVPFTIAQRYFVKNTVKSMDNPKIETAEKFKEFFGAATTMGKNGNLP